MRSEYAVKVIVLAVLKPFKLVAIQFCEILKLLLFSWRLKRLGFSFKSAMTSYIELFNLSFVKAC